MDTSGLKAVANEGGCRLYELNGTTQAQVSSGDAVSDTVSVRRFLATTPESRLICNDPFVYGVQYTESLKRANTDVLRALKSANVFRGLETSTAVLHILRGGLNFGLREALAEAFGWNSHASAFVSAQRARKSDNPEEWYITENAYEKVFLPREAYLVFGDVVATGTSLEYALRHLLEIVERDGVAIQGMLFFTIGGIRAEELLSSIDELCRKQFSGYQGSSVIYLEGRFDVASPQSNLSIKYTGTDLLRSNSIVAPEFYDSQYQDPAYPLERCTIYDAGSRAFWLPEYLEDVADYWEKTEELAKNGMTFARLLEERYPELDPTRFGNVDLRELCDRQRSKATAFLP